MDLWEWVTTTSSVDALLTTLGLGSLAILFATDRIITKGQHLRRVQDLVAHHERERAAEALRLADIAKSRDGWKEAAGIERARADRATATAVETSAVLTRVLHVLESLDRALPHPVGSDHERT